MINPMIFDKDYIMSLDGQIFENICGVLGCKTEDITGIEPMKVGLTNVSFRFEVDGKSYIYRHPGKGTSRFIKRECEAFSETQARKLELDGTFITMDTKSGWKLAEFLEGCQYLDPYSREDQTVAMAMLKKLHGEKITCPWDYDYMNMTGVYAALLEEQQPGAFIPYEKTYEDMSRLYEKMEAEGYEKCLCHNDAWHYNMLRGADGTVALIDWEYSGNAYPAVDVAYFTASLDFDDGDYMALAELYEGHPLTNKEKRFYFACLAICLWHWFVWAIYKEAIGTRVDDKQMWYDKALHAYDVAWEMFEKEQEA